MTAAAADDPPLSARRARTILVVEDDVSIRYRICDALRYADYKVIEAATSAEAIKILKTVSVDLLFIDLHLPHPNEGFRVAALAKRRQPDIKVLMTSPRLHATDAAIAERFGTYIRKPYLISRVLALVGEALVD
ncbi:response regulator [Methylobacterium oryzisoli]